MSYNVFSIPPFDKQIKRLTKKYPSLKNDFEELLERLEENPKQGKALAKNCYKIRLAIKSKKKGKSGGARVILHVDVVERMVFLLTIYDKLEKSDISDKEIKYLLSFILE